MPTGECCPDETDCDNGNCVTESSKCETDVYCCGCNDDGKCNDYRDAAGADSTCWDHNEVVSKCSAKGRNIKCRFIMIVGGGSSFNVGVWIVRRVFLGYVPSIV